MQLYLDSFGAYLGVKNKMFWLSLKHHDAELIAVRDVHAVFLTKGVSVSTGAMNEERKENLKNNNGVLQLNTFYQLMTIFVVCVMTVFTIQKITHGGRFPF